MERTYRGNALDNQNPHGISRRNLIRNVIMLGGAATLGSVLAYFVNEYAKRKTIDETRHFRVLQKGDETYAEKKIFGENRVFKIIYDSPLNGGPELLVKRHNPRYDDAEAQEVGKLLIQLYENPTLKNLEKSTIVKIPDIEGKTLRFIYADRKYPVPREIKGIKNLEDVLRNMI